MPFLALVLGAPIPRALTLSSEVAPALPTPQGRATRSSELTPVKRTPVAAPIPFSGQAQVSSRLEIPTHFLATTQESRILSERETPTSDILLGQRIAPAATTPPSAPTQTLQPASTSQLLLAPAHLQATATL